MMIVDYTCDHIIWDPKFKIHLRFLDGTLPFNNLKSIEDYNHLPIIPGNHKILNWWMIGIPWGNIYYKNDWNPLIIPLINITIIPGESRSSSTSWIQLDDLWESQERTVKVGWFGGFFGQSSPGNLPDTLNPGNLTVCELENGHRKWIYPLKMVIVHSYVNVYQRVPGLVFT